MVAELARRAEPVLEAIERGVEAVAEIEIHFSLVPPGPTGDTGPGRASAQAATRRILPHPPGIAPSRPRAR